MWRLIDKEMSLKDCNIYCYAPEEDPYDGEEGAIWSFNYFFFNKARKRVCYFYLRGQSLISTLSPTPKTPIILKRGADLEWDQDEPTSAKRARYWLGDRAADAVSAWAEDENDCGFRDDEALPEYGTVEDESPQPATDKEPPTQMVFSPEAAASLAMGRPSAGRGRSESTARADSSDTADRLIA